MTGPGSEASASDLLSNRLLATFPEDLLDRIRERADIVYLDEGTVVLSRGKDVTRSLFPLGQTMISLNAELENGRSVEVASIGREGAIGGIVSCGHAPAFARAEVIVAGRALSLPMEFVEASKAQSGHLRNLFCRYADYLLAQIMQSVACNAFHPIEARAARWLLTAQDRAGDRIALTQESLAGLLGVQRTTINAVARDMQDAGLIAIRRGAIEILDRDGLTARSCSCYDSVERFFGYIIGDSGTGGNEGCD